VVKEIMNQRSIYFEKYMKEMEEKEEKYDRLITECYRLKKEL